MTYGDAYNKWLEELLAAEFQGEPPAWIYTAGSLAETYKNNDPTAYRCGFADWTYGMRDYGLCCENCGRELTDPDVCEDDDLVCSVCAGNAFECEDCGEVFPAEDRPLGDVDLCEDCHEVRTNAQANE